MQIITSTATSYYINVKACVFFSIVCLPEDTGITGKKRKGEGLKFKMFSGTGQKKALCRFFKCEIKIILFHIFLPVSYEIFLSGCHTASDVPLGFI